VHEVGDHEADDHLEEHGGEGEQARLVDRLIGPRIGQPHVTQQEIRRKRCSSLSVRMCPILLGICSPHCTGSW
jgi:hypothetical protein